MYVISTNMHRGYRHIVYSKHFQVCFMLLRGVVPRWDLKLTGTEGKASGNPNEMTPFQNNEQRGRNPQHSLNSDA